MDNHRRAEILAELARHTGKVVSWKFLSKTGDFVPGIDRFHHLMTGIYKPAGSEYALSIIMRSKSPYDHKDEVVILEDGRWLMTYSPRSGGLEISDNRALVRCMDNRMPLAVFQQETDKTDKQHGSTYRVLGLGLITNFDPQKDVFIVESVDLPALMMLTTQIEDEKARYEVQLYAQLTNQFHPFIREDNITYTVSSPRRDDAFREIILREYDFSCAVCQMKFRYESLVEAQAAHIVPKREHGTDDPRNGLALCRTHHWAFDSGLFAITESYTILVSPVVSRSDVRNFDLESRKEQRILLPGRDVLHPHSEALSWHRQNIWRS
ncbi:MAG: HNH endonuclease [Chloroflexota bacterium]